MILPSARRVFRLDCQPGAHLRRRVQYSLRRGVGSSVWHSALLLAVFVLSGFGCSQVERPDFSGTWELDAAQSNFGPVPGPSQSTQVIEHQEPLLRLTADSEGFMGDTHVELEMVTDGSETMQTVDGRPRKLQTYWEGAVLVTAWEIANPGRARFEMVDRRSLSTDGQTMTVERQMHSNGADWQQKAVFVRKASGQAAPAADGCI